MLAQVEIPQSSCVKYEFKNGNLVMDRELSGPVPYNYGFLPNSEVQPDGDLADIFIVTTWPLYPGTHVEVDIVCIFKCLDNGVEDDKYVGVPNGKNVSSEALLRIEYYLENYKSGFEVLGVDKLDLSRVNQ